MTAPAPDCPRCTRLRAERDQLHRRLIQAETERDEQMRRSDHVRARRRFA